MRKKLENDDAMRWDALYKAEKGSQPIQNDIPHIVEIFKKYDVNRVLDLACGSGRHSLYLAEQGFDVFGMDISEDGIKKAKSLLQTKGLHANLTVGSFYKKLPYEDDFFDAILCIRALHHGIIGDVRKAINEMERVLKPKGLVYITVRKETPEKKRLPFKLVEPRTYVPLEGNEKGVVHYLFNKKILREEFRNFDILELNINFGPKEWEAYYCLLGEMKEKL